MPRATDIQWKGRWYRPGPVFQARVLGLWPDQGDGVWSPALFEACLQGPEPPLPFDQLPEIGCDCATGKGDDYHAIHVRWGRVSVHHETSNTMDPAHIYDRLRAVCDQAAGDANRRRQSGHTQVRPGDIRIKIDDDGTGNAVCAFLRRGGYNVTLISAAGRASRSDVYHRKRDELWFQTAGKARDGLVYFGRLDKPTLARLRQQLLAPAFELQQRSGMLIVEEKAITKEKILRSPDDADAVNLAFYESLAVGQQRAIDNPEPRLPWNQSR